MNFALSEMTKLTKTFVFFGKGMVRPPGLARSQLSTFAPNQDARGFLRVLA